MAVPGGELIAPVIDSEVLVIAQVHEPVIAASAVGVDHRAGVQVAPDHGLQRGLGAIRDDLGVDLIAALQQPEHDSFARRAPVCPGPGAA